MSDRDAAVLRETLAAIVDTAPVPPGLPDEATQPVGPQRWSVPALAVAAVAVVVVVAVAGAMLSQEPQSDVADVANATIPSSTTTVTDAVAPAPRVSSTTTSTTEALDPGYSELLQADDLPGIPGMSSWTIIGMDDDVLLDPTAFNGLTVPFCVDPTLVLNEWSWKLTATPPLTELAQGPFAATTNTGAFLMEAVYIDDQTSTSGAFDALVAELEACLDSYNPTLGFVPEYVEDGWHWVADRYDLPPIGDEWYAISFHSAKNGDDRPDSAVADIQLGIVRSGDRLLLIMAGYWFAGDEQLTDSEFSEIMHTATSRLAP
jgi:hypothetical protein